MQELSQRCRGFLDRSRPAATLSNNQLIEALNQRGLDRARFERVLELNERIGGGEVQNKTRTDCEIWMTLGAMGTFSDATDPSIRFFDFGVAAPYGVDLRPDGSVIASDGIETIAVAESFEVFLEGIALEHHLGSTTPADGVDFSGDFAEAISGLPLTGRLPEASDRFTTWWMTDDFAARADSYWGQVSLHRLVVWNPERAPLTFTDFLEAHRRERS